MSTLAERIEAAKRSLDNLIYDPEPNPIHGQWRRIAPVLAPVVSENTAEYPGARDSKATP